MKTHAALFTASILSAAVVIFTVFFGLKNIYRPAFNASTHKIIIDAGHGLPDGGAVAADGTIESDINLAIARLLNDMLTAAGFECIMTRTDENSICTDGGTIHAKKVSDTKNRVAIARKNSDAFVVSIHMNTYTTPDVHGSQVFYKSGSDISKEIAEEVQRIINLKYQPDNKKTVKPIPSNVYLFKNISNNSILAECGFLTNEDDLKKLKSAEFQQDIAKSIAEVVTFKLIGSDINGN